MTIQQAMESAVAHHQAGRLRDAEAIYRQVLTVHPNHADALHLLGVLNSQSGHHQSAIDLITLAIAANPNAPEFYANLGVALAELGRAAEAVSAYDRSIALQPRSPQVHSNRGNALAALGRADEAIVSLRRAIELNSDYADAHFNLANVLRDQNRLDESIAEYTRAIALSPNSQMAVNNLGNVLCSAGRYDQAKSLYEQALARWPDYPLAHWNLGLLLLRKGDLANGLREYEWRWQVKELGMCERNITKPLWDGGDLNGRRILLYGEQGLGDTIQFIRYLPMLAAKGGTILVSCHAELSRLLSHAAGLAEYVTQWVGSKANMADFDVHCPLASLPRKFRTSLANIPAKTPYLFADDTMADHWRQRLANIKGLKVGLAWAGRPAHPNDRKRSMSLEQLQPLTEIPGISLVSLQKGDPARQIQSAPAGNKLTDWTAELTDFAETAALVAALDVVVTVDTAVAHLAGAMGKPVWVLLPFVPDWRWMLERTDSPWYPTMRLFRQRAPDDWQTPVRELAQALATVHRLLSSGSITFRGEDRRS